MRAIVLAAGEGRRNRPLTRTRPKVMLPVGNRPILEHVVAALHAAGVHDVTLVVGYHAEAVQTHFQDGARFGVRITYAHQPKRAGTADAFARGLAAARGFDDVLLVPGDTYVGPEVLARFLAAAGNNDALLYTTSTHPQQYGVVEIVDDQVRTIDEKPARPQRDTISTGIARLSAATAARVKAHAKSLTGMIDFLGEVAKGKARLRGVPLQGSWFDVDRPEGLLEANALYLAGIEPKNDGVVEPGASVVGPVAIGPGARIRSGSYIVGPAIIGAGCEIGPHTVIYGPTSIGDNVTIGPFTEVLESVLLRDVRIASGCTLHHAVLDDGVVLAPRVMMDRAHGVDGPGFGAVVGQGTVLGNQVSVQAGSVIDAGVRVAPGKRVGDLAQGARVV